MKPLLLLLSSCFCCAASMAQKRHQMLPKFGPERPLMHQLPKNFNARILPDTSIQLRDFALRNKKPGVYLLPQDNMPCIVPDSGKTVNIPNAWRGPKTVPFKGNPPHIPNPAQKWTPTPISNTDSNAK